MTYEQLSLLAESYGFTAWAPLDIGTIRPKQEVRDMCAANTCRKYGTSWCCPPGCGSLEDCFRELQQYRYGILVQTCGEIEDSFDYEAKEYPMQLSWRHVSLKCTDCFGLREKRYWPSVPVAVLCAKPAHIRMNPAVFLRNVLHLWRHMECWCWKSAKTTACNTTTELTK